MSFDGITEETNTRALLAGIAGGRLFDMEPDDVAVPVDTLGAVRPYIVLSFGVPFAHGAGNRSIGDTERTIPYTLTFVVGCYAGDRDSLNALYKEVSNRLVGASLNGNNATPVRIPYGYNGKTKSTKSRPAIFSKIAACACTINMSTP